MPSSPPPDLAAATAAAGRLAPSPPTSVRPWRGGGNSRIYRVDTTGGGCYALKSYPSPGRDFRDRLGAEWGALTFLRGCGVADVPVAVAVDRDAGMALYGWVDGEPIADPGADDVDAALAFIGHLHALRLEPDASGLPLASEACLSVADVLDQIAQRRDRLAAISDRNLAGFLAEEFAPALADAERHARRICVRRGWDLSIPVPVEQRTLSPSDFGFHNALRRPDGRLAFVDFEYFGWDDAAKLVSDFLQHPAMSLTPSLAERFLAGAVRLYGDAFHERLAFFFPLIGLRWCMILLNEFLPDRWRGWVFAGMREAARAGIKQRQLAKSRARLTAVRFALKESAL